MNNGINVNSEIGKLKSVLLHRPGAEVENITPDTMKQLLFDDIPYLKIAQKEHDFFAQTLRDNGAETVYIENLATEVFEKSSETKEEFLSHLLHEAGYRPGRTYDGLTEYLTSMSTKDMVEKIYAGVRKNELDIKRKYSFSDRCRYYLPQENVKNALAKLLANLKEHPVPLPLLSQYMPFQYTLVREGKLNNTPEDLIKARVMYTIEEYTYASHQEELVR